MNADQQPPDQVLDATGLECASLTPLVSTTLAALPPAALLEVRTDDPAARMGLPAWCRLTRNPLVHTFEGPDRDRHLTADQTIFHITKKER